MTDPRIAHMLPYEIEREDARELIRWYAEHGRVKAAWSDCRHEIQKHFENRPEDGALYGRLVEPWRDWSGTRAKWDAHRAHQIARGHAAHAEWLASLRELLALRRSIPQIAADAARRLTASQRDRRAMFNRFIGETA